MPGFGEMAVTPAVSQALDALRAATGRVEGPMERHCLRVRYIAAQLARRRGSIDDEVVTVAAILHDIGLYPNASRGGVHTEDGAEPLRELNRTVPRRGLIAELARELGRAVRQRPLTIPRIFWRT